MNKALRDHFNKLDQAWRAFNDAKDAVDQFRRDATAARAERERLMTSEGIDPYSDTDVLALTILDNRTALLEAKAERLEGRIMDLRQVARQEAQRAHGALVDLLREQAEAHHRQIAAKMAKAMDLSEDEATKAALEVGSVQALYQRVNLLASQLFQRDDPAEVLAAMKETA